MARPNAVTNKIEAEIYKHIEALIRTESPERASVREQALASYRAKNRPSGRARDEYDDLRKASLLSYEKLPELLGIADMNIRDMYMLAKPLYPDKITGSEWVSGDARELVAAADKLAAPRRDKVKELAFRLSCSFWREPETARMSPTRKAIAVYRRFGLSQQVSYNGLMELAAFKKVYDDKKQTTSLKTEDLPEVARRLEISLHWLMLPVGGDGAWIAAPDRTIGVKRRRLRSVLDECVWASSSYEEFLERVSESGYDVKNKGALLFRERRDVDGKFVRGYSSRAGHERDNYSEERLRERIASGEKRWKHPATVLAKSEETEIIMDAYLFMPKKVRPAFKEYVEILSKEGVKYNGRTL